MNVTWIALSLLAGLQAPAESPAGEWRAVLESPGGELGFDLFLQAQADGGLRATLGNGDERIPIPVTTWEAGELRLEMPHYDSLVRARLERDEGGGPRLSGEWTKRSGPDRLARLSFRAAPLVASVQAASTLDGEVRSALAGRWAVRFASSEDPAVAVFRTQGTEVQGTFLTTLGDYRFLAGELDLKTGRLTLSCFDGAHAFLFEARLIEDGTLAGDFWSRDSWHETWSARRDDEAALPDPFGLTTAVDGVELADLRFPDAGGKVWSLADPSFDGRARILQLFGTWCPNCNDEAPFLAELDQRYRARGLSIVGLAFELTGDFERDARQVELYAARHGVRFPLLVGGLSDKAEASKRFPLLDRVRSYPTTIFLRRDGSVRAVHQGYAGPATGPEHEKLRADFERLIEELLAEEQR